MSSLVCRQCGQPITFDNKHVSQRTGKKIPLAIETNEPDDCPARKDQQQSEQQEQQTQRRQEIYFDANNKSQSGKYIPLVLWLLGADLRCFVVYLFV